MSEKTKEKSNQRITGGTNFYISILHQEYNTYQGFVEWLDTGKKMHFRSELELLNLIHSALPINQNGQQRLRTWDDSQRLASVK